MPSSTPRLMPNRYVRGLFCQLWSRPCRGPTKVGPRDEPSGMGRDVHLEVLG